MQGLSYEKLYHVSGACFFFLTWGWISQVWGPPSCEGEETYTENNITPFIVQACNLSIEIFLKKKKSRNKVPYFQELE